jgi:hypothetical protein
MANKKRARRRRKLLRYLNAKGTQAAMQQAILIAFTGLTIRDANRLSGTSVRTASSD